MGQKQTNVGSQKYNEGTEDKDTNLNEEEYME